MQVTWDGNAETMFERMLEEVPVALRNTFRGKLMEVALAKAGEGNISEDHVVEIVEEKVPDPFKTNILKAYATMGGVDLTKVEDIIRNTPGGEEVILNILHSVQEQFGYTPEEALVLLSQRKGIPLAKLYRLVTTYQAYSVEQPREHTITVCTCSACYLKGAGAILSDVRKRAADCNKAVALKTVRGLGCCNISPAVLIDGAVYSGNRALEKIEQVLGR